MSIHGTLQKLLYTSQLENLAFSQMTFREISSLNRPTPFTVEVILSQVRAIDKHAQVSYW